MMQDTKLKDFDNAGTFYMSSKNIEQANVNNQSNMTLCSQSEITQSNLRFKIDYDMGEDCGNE